MSETGLARGGMSREGGRVWRLGAFFGACVRASFVLGAILVTKCCRGLCWVAGGSWRSRGWGDFNGRCCCLSYFIRRNHELSSIGLILLKLAMIDCWYYVSL